jgi:hypothetical protein
LWEIDSLEIVQAHVDEPLDDLTRAFAHAASPHLPCAGQIRSMPRSPATRPPVHVHLHLAPRSRKLGSEDDPRAGARLLKSGG